MKTKTNEPPTTNEVIPCRMESCPSDGPTVRSSATCTGAGSAPVWFDVLMIIWFAWTGLLLGVVSLYFMQEIVARTFGAAAGWIFALAVAILNSVGIYLGRFMRWNSWDILQDPLPIAHDIWSLVRHPFSNVRIYGFILLFTLLFLFVYLALHAFGRVMQEYQPLKKS